MGRISRLYPKGRLRLRIPKMVQSGKKYPLYIEYNWHADSIRKSTGISVSVKEWNEKGYCGIGEIRATTDIDYKYYNHALHKRIEDIDVKIHKYYEMHQHITCDVIRSFLEDNDNALRPDEGKDFIEFAKELMEKRYEKGKIGFSTCKNGISYLNQFEEYLLLEHKGTHGEHKEFIYVSDISEDLLLDFRKYRLLAKKKATTVNKTLCPILQACEYACQLGYISHQLNASLQDLYMKEEDRLDEEERNIKYFTEERLAELVSVYNTIEQPRRKEFLEMWLFAFHACGMRMVDVMTLRWKDIDFNKNFISKIQVKTRNRNTIPLSEPLIRILEKWKGRNKVFVFDLLPENFDINDHEAIYRRRNSWNNTINTSLRCISHDLKWNQDLTFHVSRHTWAVLALAHGAEISEISRLLGHASTGVTERVYAEFLPANLATVVSKLGFCFIPDMNAKQKKVVSR